MCRAHPTTITYIYIYNIIYVYMAHHAAYVETACCKPPANFCNPVGLRANTYPTVCVGLRGGAGWQPQTSFTDEIGGTCRPGGWPQHGRLPVGLVPAKRRPAGCIV